MSRADISLDVVFRAEAGRLVAWLARLLGPGRLALIEDAVQDAFASALARWPAEGVPDKPAAWLGVAARNKALDQLRREARSAPFDEAVFDEAGAWRLAFADPEAGGSMDDTLALMFVACHPALDHETQTMLTLKTVCGFHVAEIARAAAPPATSSCWRSRTGHCGTVTSSHWDRRISRRRWHRTR